MTTGKRAMSRPVDGLVGLRRTLDAQLLEETILRTAVNEARRRLSACSRERARLQRQYREANAASDLIGEQHEKVRERS
jgi:hypothetical protein